ncbi:hypothetical protein [Vagococcus humatus]|uniref:Uncharacterized protein n=1 Tax=Vagococcus humatus TaxID=1889241 RepID=A0A3R9YFJ3_9ENTE|nr:hypothetical protein [Vagococcus humatus]RST90008.1 hypothetical protein C7P63_02710 [Vagococcus humatus]
MKLVTIHDRMNDNAFQVEDAKEIGGKTVLKKIVGKLANNLGLIWYLVSLNFFIQSFSQKSVLAFTIATTFYILGNMEQQSKKKQKN